LHQLLLLGLGSDQLLCLHLQPCPSFS
jgi:hypothetical protein